MSGERHGYDGWDDGQAFCLCGSTFPSMDAFENHVGMTAPDPTAGEPPFIDCLAPSTCIRHGECRDHEPCPDFPATPDAGAVEALVLTIARSLNRHALSRPYGEKAAWCVCLTWSIDQTEDRAADERAYEVHVATHVAAGLADHDAATADRVRRETAEGIARKAERLRRENPMNGDGANYMLDKVQQVIGAPEAVADERRLLDAERAEAYERLEAENAAREQAR